MIYQVRRREIRPQLLAMIRRDQCRIYAGDGMISPSGRKRLKELEKVAGLAFDQA
jgi:hypothetical protein